MNITLVGFMGTGKSSVGKRLARKRKMRFVDTDELIEKKTGAAIPEIFAKQGEKKFREIERAVVREVAGQDGLVISAGGGVVLNKENVEDLKKNGPIVCLNASPEQIWLRVRDSSRRPLLNVPEPEKRIAELLDARKPAYALSDFQISTDGKTVFQVLKEVEKAVEKVL